MRFSVLAAAFTSLLVVTSAFPVQPEARSAIAAENAAQPNRFSQMWALRKEHSGKEDEMDKQEKAMNKKLNDEEDAMDSQHHKDMWNLLVHGQVKPAQTAGKVAKRGGTSPPTSTNPGMMASMRARLPNMPKMPTWSGIRASIPKWAGGTKPPTAAQATKAQIKGDAKLAGKMQANHDRLFKQEKNIAAQKAKLFKETNPAKNQKMEASIGKAEAKLNRENAALAKDPFHPVQGTRMERVQRFGNGVVEKVKGMMPSRPAPKNEAPKGEKLPMIEWRGSRGSGSPASSRGDDIFVN